MSARRMMMVMLGMLVGAFLAMPAQAQQSETVDEVEAMGGESVRGYLLFHSTITDRDQLRIYGRAMVPVMERYGGRFLVLADGSEALEGTPDTRRVAVIEFPSLEAARAFYASEDYQAAKALRADAGQFDVVLIEGLLPAGALGGAVAD